MLVVVSVLDEIEQGNVEHGGERTRGLEGPVGNFSKVVRRSINQLTSLLVQQVEGAQRLGAPQRCLDAMQATATTTLIVECFFTGQRSKYPNPYALQYAQNWASALLIEAARHGAVSFSFHTHYARLGRGHYHDNGASASAQRSRHFALKKPTPKKIGKSRRLTKLAALRRLAALFKQARQGRVTDKGKERVGSAPASTYAPPAMLLGATTAHPTLVDVSAEAGAAASAASSSAATEEHEVVLFRSSDVVSVHSVTGVMWIAQLKQPIIMQVEPSASGQRLVTFASDRVDCRYFVPTAELYSPDLQHAATWWRERSGAQKLADEDAALVRAAASDGIHFSFEKVDRVTCSTVCSMLSTAEACLYRGQLVSFAVAEEALEVARERISVRQAERDAAEQRESAQRAGEAEAQIAAEVAQQRWQWQRALWLQAMPGMIA